jgi:SAM-dependent methyltransferase
MVAVGGFDMSYTLVRCRHCGFYFANQLADAVTFNKYYQFVSKYDVLSLLSAVDQERINLAVRFLEAHIDKNINILDIGCGSGAFLGSLKRKGWLNLQGLDPAPNASKIASELYEVQGIKLGTLANAHDVLNLQKIDLVCFMSVLEHLPNLKLDLAQFLAKLPLGCKILIEVPAIEFFPNQKCEPFGEFSLEHIQFFDLSSLKNLMSSLGAESVALELIDLPSVASGAILGLFEWRGREAANQNFTLTQINLMDRYIEQSHQQLILALKKIPAGPLILFGAGSHSARLLGYLEKIPKCEVNSIVDSNPNLVGKQMGRWTVKSTETINATPQIPVLVSSFRSQNAIASQLKESVNNPIVLMYE